MADPQNYYVQEALKDGTPVTIRAIRKDDKESIRNAFRALDREAVYRRFFSQKEDPTDAELEQVTDVDFRQVVALVATVSQADGKEIVIGDGRYVADKGEKPERAGDGLFAMAGGSLLRCTVLRNTLTWPRPTGEINKPKIGGEGGIRSHGTVTRTTVFEIIIQAQIGTGGKVNSRWFRPLIWTYFRASLVYWKRVRYRWLRAPATNLQSDLLSPLGTLFNLVKECELTNGLSLLVELSGLREARWFAVA